MDELFDMKEAAEFLGLSYANVGKLKRDGILPFIRIGRKNKFPRGAVEELRKEREQGLSARTLRGEVAKFNYELKKLRRQVEFIMFKLQMQEKKWNFSDADLLSFYSQSEEPTPQLSMPFIHGWLEVAMYLSEVEYERLAAMTGDPHPWRRVFTFIEKVIAKIKRKRSYRKSVDQQNLVHTLVSTQKEVRKCGLVMLTSMPVTMPATQRFDILVTDEPQEIDPDEMLKHMKLYSKAAKKDQKSLNRMTGVSPASLKVLPSAEK